MLTSTRRHSFAVTGTVGVVAHPFTRSADRRHAAGRATPGRVAGVASATTLDSRSTTSSSTALARIQAVIDAGGQIMVGTVAPIKDAAVAHDGKKTLAMLRRRPREPLPDLLIRLDAAVATAQASGSRVDEINTPTSDTRYKL